MRIGIKTEKAAIELRLSKPANTEFANFQRQQNQLKHEKVSAVGDFCVNRTRGSFPFRTYTKDDSFSTATKTLICDSLIKFYKFSKYLSIQNYRCKILSLQGKKQKVCYKKSVKKWWLDHFLCSRVKLFSGFASS